MKINTKEYDQIPAECLGPELLELGGGSGRRQLASNKKHYFLKANWTNVDRKATINSLQFTFINADIDSLPGGRKWTGKFDTILLVEVMEHIDIRKWKGLFEKLKKWLKPGGHIVITTPLNENMNKTIRVYQNNEHDHCTFGINRKTFVQFLPGCKTKIFGKWGFREENEGIVRPVLRFFKRIIVGSYFVNNFLPMRPKILMTWKKDGN